MEDRKDHLIPKPKKSRKSMAKPKPEPNWKLKAQPESEDVESEMLESGAQKPRVGLGGFGMLALATGALRKWHRNLTEERRQKIKSLFTVPRNDPLDPYKPNSEKAVKKISEEPLKRPLPVDDEDMLQTIAIHYDYCLPLDIVNWKVPLRDDITKECKEQLDKLPTWLKAVILLRYDKIHDYFGPKTHIFLRMLANRVDYQRSIPMKIFELYQDEDEEDYYTINKGFVIAEDDMDVPLVAPTKNQQSLMGSDLFRVAHMIAVWRLPKSARAEWAINVVHRSACTLRRAMLTQCSPAEIAMVTEDDKLHVSSEETDDEDLYKPQSWEEIISEKPEFKEEIENQVQKDFETAPPEFRNYHENVAPKLRRRREAKRKEEEVEKAARKKERSGIKWWKRNKLYTSRAARKTKHETLLTRGLYRRYSRIWKKDCPMEEISPVKRRTHHNRLDEGFHAYIVALVGSQIFKAFIMVVIIANAIVLAIETGQEREDYITRYEILDNFFLSIYFVEFLVKVYAHPQRYWRSGFNIFDFIILVVSFVKSIGDWLSLAEVQFLRVLVIVRALRILRGVSINIQIQVLVTALVETLKTHVLSVLILLLLLMYISSIISYYLFGDIVPEEWGNIGRGMLNLFAFVTMDGWTDMIESFAEHGLLHQGRFFCLVGIVLGNFVFSNIFIAIIIMQISEATEAFRIKLRDDRETVVKRKKETVFRRQKLDMRQLLARQKLSISVDFYYLASQFQRLLRHDDLVEMNEMMFTPMWIDCINRCSQRCLHTANMLMNLHRQVADNLLDLYKLYHKSKPAIKPIRRARYNRCLRLKAKLALLKNEFYRSAITKSDDKVALLELNASSMGLHSRLLVKLPSQGGGDTN